jgi:NADH:ubiquinone reductase (H+-translocating)
MGAGRVAARARQAPERIPALPKLPVPLRHPAAPAGRRPRVVILGAGFGGLNVARALGGSDTAVLLIDRNNYHGFWPLLYQVATAGLEPESIAYPVRGIVRRYRNVMFRMARVQSVDLQARAVAADGLIVHYDYLVLALGSANNYFGNDALAAQTLGLKDIDDAEELRNRVLSSFEQAVNTPDPARRRALLTFAIIGGGPTGVELAGAFAELIHHALSKDFPMLDTAQARVVLIEATDKILAAFPESLQRAARRRLEILGVEVRLNAAVQGVERGEVRFKDGTSLQAQVVVWAAGVRGSRVLDGMGLSLARGARVQVTPALNLADHPEVFAIGDLAYLEGYKGGPYPQLAPVAMQQGKLVGKNILASIAGRPLKPFHYFDKGSMATIGRRAAVFDAFGIRLTGVVAWFGWLFVHLIYLIGFRNRVIVLANWAYNYFTYDRGVRLISGKK